MCGRKFSYFCKYDELPRVVACPGVPIPSIEKSLYDPNLKNELRKKYLGIETPQINSLTVKTFSLEEIEEVLDGVVDDGQVNEIKHRLRERKG